MSSSFNSLYTANTAPRSARDGGAALTLPVGCLPVAVAAICGNELADATFPICLLYSRTLLGAQIIAHNSAERGVVVGDRSTGAETDGAAAVDAVALKSRAVIHVNAICRRQ